MSPQTQNFVLFVDDDPDDREIVLECCQELQIAQQARFMESGEELFHFLSAIADPADYPSLIVLDINMRGMDGEETLLKLKSHPFYRHIPVVMFSTGSRHPKHYISIGAEAFYFKPDNYSQLRNSVSAFFQRLK